ncbi:acrylyl-CoA reductase (NADPH) [Marinomonas epiphytica]
MFQALLINQNDQGKQEVRLAQVNDNQLPEGEVLVEVSYSTLNYKDALAITGKGRIVRSYPMVPGIDLVGQVISSQDARFKESDWVLLNGFGVGEGHWGGLAQKAQLKGDWLIPLPEGMPAKHTMAIGTAGYTAMLSVLALEKHGVLPSDGEILVTGANGGVGSFAISILKRLGYQVVASTGRVEQTAYLKSLGAVEVIDRQLLSEPGKPLQKERWAGVIDCVGSHTLANACAATRYGGIVTACGLAQGMDFPSTVAPFILRGVQLVGIDSVMRPLSDRQVAWDRLTDLFKDEDFTEITEEIDLSSVEQKAHDLLAGKVRGRLIVKC